MRERRKAPIGRDGTSPFRWPNNLRAHKIAGRHQRNPKVAMGGGVSDGFPWGNRYNNKTHLGQRYFHRGGIGEAGFGSALLPLLVSSAGALVLVDLVWRRVTRSARVAADTGLSVAEKPLQRQSIGDARSPMTVCEEVCVCVC